MGCMSQKGSEQYSDPGRIDGMTALDMQVDWGSGANAFWSPSGSRREEWMRGRYMCVSEGLVEILASEG